MDAVGRLAGDHVTRVQAREWRKGQPLLPLADALAVEEPLEIRVEGVPTAITMRTPGEDVDLTIGFLATEGVIDGMDDVRAIATVAENTVDVRLAEGVPTARARSADRALYATSSCGVCGKASLDRLLVARRAPLSPWTPDPAMLATLPARLRVAQEGFLSSGGLHAAALFDTTGLLHVVREDVGRHNAVDKVIGACLGADLPMQEGVGLLVTSRGGFEIVQKALVVGIPVVAVLGAATTLAVDAARAGGITLVGWLRGERWVGYTP